MINPYKDCRLLIRDKPMEAEELTRFLRCGWTLELSSKWDHRMYYYFSRLAVDGPDGPVPLDARTIK